MTAANSLFPGSGNAVREAADSRRYQDGGTKACVNTGRKRRTSPTDPAREAADDEKYIEKEMKEKW